MKSTMSFAALSAALLWSATAVALTDAGRAQPAPTAIQPDAGTSADQGAGFHRLLGALTAIQPGAGTSAAVEAVALTDAGWARPGGVLICRLAPENYRPASFKSGHDPQPAPTAIQPDVGTSSAAEAVALTDAGRAQPAPTAIQPDAGTSAAVENVKAAMHDDAPYRVASQFA